MRREKEASYHVLTLKGCFAKGVATLGLIMLRGTESWPVHRHTTCQRFRSSLHSSKQR